jgi:glycosyltransferase involved in cell wall biosynthesis
MGIDKRPFVSVLITTYNYGHFIEWAIDSVLAQTLNKDDMEVIVVDDGSTDDTHLRLKRYDGRVICIRKDNGGQASAFNCGIRRARGEIIALLDSDDYWASDKLQITADHFKKNDALDIFYHNLQIVDTYGTSVRPYYTDIPAASAPEKIDTASVLRGSLKTFPPTSGMVFRKSCLDRIMPVPEHYDICADTYMHYFSYLNAREILFVPQMHGYYRMHGKNNFLNGNEVNKLTQIIRIYPLLADDLSLYGKSSKHNIGALVKKVELLVKYWRLELKILTLPKFRKILVPWYVLCKILLLFILILRGNRVRRLLQYRIQNIQKLCRNCLGLRMGIQ